MKSDDSRGKHREARTWRKHGERIKQQLVETCNARVLLVSDIGIDAVDEVFFKDGSPMDRLTQLQNQPKLQHQPKQL